MNNNFVRVAGVALAVGLSSLVAHAQIGQQFTGSGTYVGNGGTGFGGTVGSGSLSLAYSGGTVNGSFTPGANFTGNALVLYIGTGALGIADTSTLTDTADGGRTAISGFNSGNSTRTLASFPAGFRPSYAIAIEPTFAGLFNLSTPSNFGFVANTGLAGSGTGPFTFSFTVANLGLSAATSNNIDFVGSLISTSAYRANETIGTSTTVSGTPGDVPNAGFTGSQTFTTFNRLTTFAPVVIPEPATMLLMGAALPGIALIRRRRK